MTRSPVLVYALIAIATILPGGLGSFATAGSIDDGWYDSLNRPTWNPPSWLFGPVWTTLYTMMAISAVLIHRSPSGDGRNAAFAIYGIQLLLNGAWSFAFFGAKDPALGLITIFVLDAAIALTVIAFARQDLRAAALLLPYMAWTLFATVLNATIWSLNG